MEPLLVTLITWARNIAPLAGAAEVVAEAAPTSGETA